MLDENLSVFDQNSLTVFTLNQTISGWQNIFPLFKSGTAVPNLSNGTIDYNDFGAGIMFVPSGLAYYNQARVGIPAYSPLIFSFKLKQVNFVDNEFDRIDSVFEDLNGDSNPFNDDSDGDGIPNFVDIDDDADYIPTKTEIKRPAINISTGEVLVDAISKEIIYAGYYPYNGAAVDDTSTTNIDERQGIPRKFTGPLKNPTSPESADNLRTPLPSDFTDVNRLRRHLDPTSKPPYYNKS